MQTNEAQPEDSISDYDKAWDSEEDSPVNGGVDTDEFQETSDEATATSDDAQDDEESTASTDATDTTAESESEAEGDAENQSDSEASQASAELLTLQTQNKALSDRLAVRGRELKELRKELADLKKASRQPTKFEQEFPEYAEDIKQLAGIEETDETETDTTDDEVDTVEKILSAVPDAGALYNDPSLHQYLQTDPVFVFNGAAMFVNAAIHSDNPDEVIAGLNHYKSTKQAATPAPKETPEDPLKDMVPPPTSAGKPDVPRTTTMSPMEQYDAEWAADD